MDVRLSAVQIRWTSMVVLYLCTRQNSSSYDLLLCYWQSKGSQNSKLVEFGMMCRLVSKVIQLTTKVKVVRFHCQHSMWRYIIPLQCQTKLLVNSCSNINPCTSSLHSGNWNHLCACVIMLVSFSVNTLQLWVSPIKSLLVALSDKATWEMISIQELSNKIWNENIIPLSGDHEHLDTG